MFSRSSELAHQPIDSLFPQPRTGLDEVWQALTFSQALYQKAWGNALAV